MPRFLGCSPCAHPCLRLCSLRVARTGLAKRRLVAQEAVISFLHEALLPAPDTGLRFAGPAHDLIGANTVPTQQDDLSPPDMLVWRIAVPHEHLQTAAISGLKRDGNSGSHTPDSHAPSALGIPTGIQMSDAIH